jgi:hypothetical protein
MAAPLFSPDQTVAQTLGWDGDLSRVFLDRRTACVGCYLARFCTLEDVARTYGFPLEGFLAELREAASATHPLIIGAQNE